MLHSHHHGRGIYNPAGMGMDRVSLNLHISSFACWLLPCPCIWYHCDAEPVPGPSSHSSHSLGQTYPFPWLIDAAANWVPLPRNSLMLPTNSSRSWEISNSVYPNLTHNPLVHIMTSFSNDLPIPSDRKAENQFPRSLSCFSCLKMMIRTLVTRSTFWKCKVQNTA